MTFEQMYFHITCDNDFEESEDGFKASYNSRSS